jgi:DNA-binding LacI/PurR family transcriptional regulator
MADIQIAVAAANFSHTFPMQMLSFIQAALKPGESIIQCSTAGMADSEKDRLERILEKQSPAALIGISVKPDVDTVAKYIKAGSPVILIDEEVAGTSTVTTDNYSGGYMAGDYLAKKGRKKIGAVSGRMHVEGGYNAMMRVSGMVRALAENGLTLAEGGLIEVISYSYNDGVEAMAKLIDDKTGVDAIFCAAGDMCALGMLRTARERGIRIPEDIAIIGYDDLDAARTSKPALTTIKQPLEMMAIAALEMALNQRAEILIRPKKSVFNPELVIRNSA